MVDEQQGMRRDQLDRGRVPCSGGVPRDLAGRRCNEHQQHLVMGSDRCHRWESFSKTGIWQLVDSEGPSALRFFHLFILDT